VKRLFSAQWELMQPLSTLMPTFEHHLSYIRHEDKLPTSEQRKVTNHKPHSQPVGCSVAATRLNCRTEWRQKMMQQLVSNKTNLSHKQHHPLLTSLSFRLGVVQIYNPPPAHIFVLA
jgi:hypothetical protein